LVNYLPTIANYGLAAVYVVLLTRLVPLEEYGLYNALASFAALVGLFFPTFGVDNAIAREAAAARARGGDTRPYFSAIAALALTLSALNAAAIALLAPRAVELPQWMVPIAYLMAAGAVLGALAGAYGFGLWAQGRVHEQGVGGIIQSLVFRLGEIALLLALRNVYAIIGGSLMGAAAQLAYYYWALGNRPSIRAGARVLASGLKRFLAFGIQFWGANYILTSYAALQTYLIYLWLGPAASGVYAMASTLLGVVSAFVGAVNNVFGARAAYLYGRGEPLDSLTNAYIRAGAYVAGGLALAFAAALPLIPLLRIAVGNYLAALPLAEALAPTVVIGVADGVLVTRSWVEGRGRVALARAAVGAAVGLTTLAISLHLTRSIYAAAVGAYAANLAIFAFYLASRNVDGRPALAVALALAAALAGTLPRTWWAPPLALAALLGAAAVAKPIPRGALEGMPLRWLLERFSRP
jgi:O-antigen/teichoic acid export membrane protein